jgi:hypothetical protein
LRRWVFAIIVAALALPSAAFAGPPFLTDDPEPTPLSHWEIYAPLFEADGSGRDFGGSFGTEINYGAAPGVQLTLGLPIAFAHDASGWHAARGDLRASAKYRFYHNEAAGVQIAAFPGVTLPTASHGLGAGKITALLPVWGQKDLGPWSVFGGGGFAVNTGSRNRDYWTGGIAVTRKFGERWLAGAEIDRQGPESVDGRASTSLGLGGIVDFKGPLRLLASGGPTWTDGGGSGFHAFVALGLDF